MNEPSQLDAITARINCGYIQEWLDHVQLLECAYQQVFTAIDRIVKAGRLSITTTS